MERHMDYRKFKSINRRELLRLTPVVALGAFAIPKVQEPLLKTGLAFSDWASKVLFRSPAGQPRNLVCSKSRRSSLSGLLTM